MFNLGAGEIAVIAILALLLLGPQRLPEMARGLGRFFREFRRQTDDVRSMVEREFYRMDQDVLDDPSKKEAAAPLGVNPPSRSRLISPAMQDAIDDQPRILPQPAFPAFPVPEGVVASRPPDAADPGPPATPTTADTPSSESNARSDPHADVSPGRDA
jgi:sec-independent protein translocase protein TatB